jgi:hypothetical protein
MSRQASPGKCHLCAQIIDRAAVTRHLALCSEPQTAGLSPGPSFYFVVEGRRAKNYWMHVALPVTAKLAKLDAFLRETWLECCDHLSSLEIAGERYASDPTMGEAGMKRPLQNVVGVGLNFSYEYDFGSTTELTLFESRKTGKAGYAPACANEWVKGVCVPRSRFPWLLSWGLRVG